MTAVAEALPKRWHPLRLHAALQRLVASTARFDVIEAARRSGKDEFAKRMGVVEARAMCKVYGRWYTKYCAPTLRQSRDIYWDDLLAMSQPWWSREPNKTDLCIFLRGGAELWVCGLDKPQRIEGSPCNRLAATEFADVKAGAWDKHLKPALDTEQPGYPLGRAWIMGVPRPSLQFAKLAKMGQDPSEPDFAYHHWASAEVLSPDKIAAAMRQLDPQTFEQEYLAKRVAYQGLAYYCFVPVNVFRTLTVDPKLPLITCFDFNVDPGVCAILQEQYHEHAWKKGEKVQTTCAVDEIHIKGDSRTEYVCRRLIQKHGAHKGDVMVYGDATGGQRDSASEATDWDIVRKMLRAAFGDRLRWRVVKSNPSERDRVNSVNSRMRGTTGECRFLIDPKKCARTVEDFQGVKLVEGGSGEIAKKECERQGLTHLSDAVGYYVHEKFPVGGSKEMVIY